MARLCAAIVSHLYKNEGAPLLAFFCKGRVCAASQNFPPWWLYDPPTGLKVGSDPRRRRPALHPWQWLSAVGLARYTPMP